MESKNVKKISLVGAFLGILFSLNSQVLYENPQLKLEAEILAQNNGFLLSITNKTDSILIINSRKPQYRFVDSTYEVDIQLLDFHSLPTFTEPKEYSITNLKQIFPHVKYDFFIRIDSLYLNFNKIKYWYVEFDYITFPLNQKLDYGYFNYDFRKFLSLYEVNYNTLKIKFINNNSLGDLLLKNLYYNAFKIQTPIAKPSSKKMNKRRKN